MPDINASLKTTINGKGPQHKMHRVNEFEFTEGSDGALHTKIVDKNGNPIDSSKTEVSNFPNDYPDSAVRQELESVKAELQSLKEHTFNTQLTGSNVEQDVNVLNIPETQKVTIEADDENPIPVIDRSTVLEITDNNAIGSIEPEVWTPLFEDVHIEGFTLLRFVFKLWGTNASDAEARMVLSDREGSYDYTSTSPVWLRKEIPRDEGFSTIVFSSLTPQILVGKYMKIEVKHSNADGVMNKTRALIQLNGG